MLKIIDVSSSKLSTALLILETNKIPLPYPPTTHFEVDISPMVESYLRSLGCIISSPPQTPEQDTLH